MPKPATAPKKQVVKKVRAVQLGINKWTLVEDVWEGPPTRTVPLYNGEVKSRASAEDRVRLYLEEQLGLNRFGDSGL